MEKWWVVAVFAFAGLLPAWSYVHAIKTGQIKVPAGFAKYGMTAGETVKRRDNCSLFTRITMAHLAIAICCFSFAGVEAWASQ